MDDRTWVRDRSGVASSIRSLRGIKALHTVLWAIFAGSILVIPVVTAIGDLRAGLWLSLFVTIKIIVLAINGMRCPLTGFAARYTDDRSDNFDIFLPSWLARNNKHIFGTIFVAAELFLFWRLLRG